VAASPKHLGDAVRIARLEASSRRDFADAPEIVGVALLSDRGIRGLQIGSVRMRRSAEHQPINIRVIEPHPHIGFEHQPETDGGIQPPRREPSVVPEENTHRSEANLLKEVVFIAKIQVKRGRREANIGPYLAKSGAVVPVSDKDSLRL
jgi:hypothetical protein